jgi:hypothetical protein
LAWDYTTDLWTTTRIAAVIQREFESLATNILVLNSLFSGNHSVRDRMVAARSGTVPVPAEHLLRFSRGKVPLVLIFTPLFC